METNRRAQSGLTALPFEILSQILTLILPELPPRFHFAHDDTRPPWLDIISTNKRIITCPPILLVCRFLEQQSLRILYTLPHLLSVHPGRAFLARLSHFRARNYIHNIELAIEVRYRFNSELLSDVCAPHELVSFYPPSYVVDLLQRTFPRLSSVELKVVETMKPSNSPESRFRFSFYRKVESERMTELEAVNFFPLSSLTQSESFNRLVTSLKYKTDRTFVHPRFLVGERLSASRLDPRVREPSEGLIRQLIQKRVPDKFKPLTPKMLPNLKRVRFILYTEASMMDEPWGRLSRLYSEQREQQSLREQFTIIMGDQFFGSPNLKVTLCRVQSTRMGEIGCELMGNTQTRDILWGVSADSGEV